MSSDSVASMLSKMLNFEKAGKRECIVRPISKVGKKVLEIMRDNQYIGEFNEVKDSRGIYVVIQLIGNINNCNAIKPRFAVSKGTYEKFEKRFLPARDFGMLIVSTNKGMKTHTEAKKENLGGKLVAYCY